MSRPEHLAPPELFYDENEARKYTKNTRVQKIQAEMTERCIELMTLEENSRCYLLDIGAGSGLSGEILTEMGHDWVGADISGGMLQSALERDVEGDLMLLDIGQGLPFRAGTFDGAISVSVLQWLCNADTSLNNPAQRLSRFFTDLYGALKQGSRAVFQFYPEDDEQIKFIMKFATRAGFGGGLVVDYPNSAKKKKYYLVLFAGSQQSQHVPQALGTEEENTNHAKFERRNKQQKLKSKIGAIDVDWIKRKKELYRSRGKEVPRDSKFTGRKRRVQF